MSDTSTGQVQQLAPNRYVIEIEASCDGQSVRTRYEAPTAEEVVRLWKLAESGEPVVVKAQAPAMYENPWRDMYAARSSVLSALDSLPPWPALTRAMADHFAQKATSQVLAALQNPEPAEGEADNPVIVEAEKERQ